MSLWCVVVRYATKIEPGVIEVEYDVDDLTDIATIISQGPTGFSSVAYIHVRRGDVDRFPIYPIEGGMEEHIMAIEDRTKDFESED